MTRLIDADLFKQQMSALALTSPSMFTHKVVKLLEIIDKQPTVDAVPVVRGEWIYQQGMLTDFVKCSRCGKFDEFERNFCSNCGSDMRKKVK